MSLALYSAKSKEAYKLKSNDIEITIDEEDGKRLNIENTIEPGEMVQFNCIYNKAEIDEKIVGDYFEKNGFENFGALNLMAGKGIYTWNTNGTLTPKIQYCASFNKLYERLRDSATNLHTFLAKMKDDVDSGIAPGATLNYFTGEVSSYVKEGSAVNSSTHP